MTSAGDRRGIVFVGGTRFSGVDEVAALLADNREVTRVVVLGRLHSDPWGIPALLHGRIGLDDFAARLRDLDLGGRAPGQRLDDALARLREGYDADPLRSCRDLFWALVDAPVGDDRILVEASPGNLAEAQTLLRLVPAATFLHVVRDGRDVAAAVVESDAVDVSRIAAGLDWWADELREIERGVRGEEDGARYTIPEGRLTVTVLDELAAPDGGDAFGHLLERLSLREDQRVPPAPKTRLDAAALDRGRWRGRVRAPVRRWVTRRYAGALEELDGEGNHAAPALRAAYERLG